jgi:hypothetical protein
MKNNLIDNPEPRSRSPSDQLRTKPLGDGRNGEIFIGLDIQLNETFALRNGAYISLKRSGTTHLAKPGATMQMRTRSLLSSRKLNLDEPLLLVL